MSKAKKYVFIAHHFDEKCRKLAGLLTWILNQQHIPTKYGEDVVGRLSDKVQERISTASLVIALLTRDVEISGARYQPSQWCLEEVIWAIAHNVPCILIVEEGVEFEGGIAGDLEQIHFAPGDFAGTLERVVNQATALLDSLVLPKDLPENNLSDRVWRLIMEAREQAGKGNYENFLRLSEEAFELDPTTWRAQLNIGIALVKLGRFTLAREVLLDVVKAHPDIAQAQGMAYHNLGYLEEVKSAGVQNSFEALKHTETFYEAALASLHSQVRTRACLLFCKILLGKRTEASALLMQSLDYDGFLPQALRAETVSRGYRGHQLLRELPEAEWLYPLLFPVWSGDDNER